MVSLFENRGRGPALRPTESTAAAPCCVPVCVRHCSAALVRACPPSVSVCASAAVADAVAVRRNSLFDCVMRCDCELDGWSIVHRCCDRCMSPMSPPSNGTLRRTALQCRSATSPPLRSAPLPPIVLSVRPLMRRTSVRRIRMRMHTVPLVGSRTEATPPLALSRCTRIPSATCPLTTQRLRPPTGSDAQPFDSIRTDIAMHSPHPHRRATRHIDSAADGTRVDNQSALLTSGGDDATTNE